MKLFVSVRVKLESDEQLFDDDEKTTVQKTKFIENSRKYEILHIKTTRRSIDPCYSRFNS